ncbi:exocyst subunit exo70 family protein H4 [Abeliophyllum distichum]|uniref:Exocyst subunit Exo70 family protein n=1 Tax=Abeliophyllum distichum TaxID=126358 RepID=A0ABD1QGT0_9LAMI
MHPHPKTLFNGERILSDHVFASSDSIRESCFTVITKEGAMILFRFPENVAKNSKKLLEKVFRILDMYTSISDHWPEIDSIFSFDSIANIKYQVLTSLVRLGEYVQMVLNVFESAIQKDSSKLHVASAGIHNLNNDVMNYLSILSNYSNIFSDILANSPWPANNSVMESYFRFTNFISKQWPKQLIPHPIKNSPTQLKPILDLILKAEAMIIHINNAMKKIRCR